MLISYSNVTVSKVASPCLLAFLFLISVCHFWLLLVTAVNIVLHILVSLSLGSFLFAHLLAFEGGSRCVGR